MQSRKEISPKQLLRLLKQMSQMEKNVVCLFYFENLSISNIADTLKRDKKVVQKALEKILTKMSVQLSRVNSFSGKTSQISK